MTYDRVKLSPEEIASQAYMSHMGGGADHWDRRGAFQLALLRSMGLRESSTLLDVGCGPLRGGVHFLRFLNEGNYCGFDFNESYIEAAHLVVRQNSLLDKRPRILVLQNFELSRLNQTFDYVLCFSVLNHCNNAQRLRFFEQIVNVMGRHSRLFITHGDWFDSSCYPNLGVELHRKYSVETELAPELAHKEWGFKTPGERMPILEFGLKT